jgi:hypothetical protein
MKRPHPHRRKMIMPLLITPVFPLKEKEEDLKEQLWDPFLRFPPPYVLQTREQKEPGTNKEPEENRD